MVLTELKNVYSAIKSFKEVINEKNVSKMYIYLMQDTYKGSNISAK